MRFCKNCGAALGEDKAHEEIPAGPAPEPSEKAGRKRLYLLIAAVCVIFIVAGLGYLFSQTSLSISSDPAGAGVYLDSEFRGVTPCVIHTLLPGEYQLEFRHDGYPPWQKNITVTLGRAESISADLSDNLIPDVKVACLSAETIQNTTGATDCIYKKGEAVSISGTAVRPHPKENPAITVSVYAQGTTTPLKTQSVAILSDNTYNFTFDGTTLPSGNYRLVASLPSGQKSAAVFTIESQEDTNIRILRQIVEDYHKIHTYSMDDYFICADMALDVWNIVDTRGMRAVLATGNIKDPNADWKEYNHAWVLVEAAPLQWVALETTGGYLVYKNNNPNYYRGMFFVNPKDLKTNMDLRRDYNNEIERSATIVSQYNAKASEYNAELEAYRSLERSYNTKYAGQNLTASEYQEALSMRNTLETESQKLIQSKAELDQMTITYNNEKQIMDNITTQISALAAKGANLMNS
nr:PEGA domain-containing protein [uncultured Methanoregula sp.]